MRKSKTSCPRRRSVTASTKFALTSQIISEEGLKKIANHFPGFEYETIYGTKGWGGALSRNDLDRGPDGKAGSFFSRVEMTVRPQNEFDVINIVGKGTIRDKEMFVWKHFDGIAEADQAQFVQMIDNWLLQFAEQFAAR